MKFNLHTCNCNEDDLYKAARGIINYLDGTESNESIVKEGTKPFRLTYKQYAIEIDNTLDNTLKEIKTYLNTILKLSLTKAVLRPRQDYKYPLTQQQLDYIQQIIINHQDRFMIEYMGMEHQFDDKRLKELYKLGYIQKKARLRDDFITNMYWMARFYDLVKVAPDYATMLALAYRLPPSIVDLAGVEWMRLNGANYLRGLGNNYARDISKRVIQYWQSTISNVIAEAHLAGYTASQLESELKALTQDYARDWRRIAITELHNLHEWGMVAKIRAETGQQNPLVFKMPNPSACEGCKELFLRKDGSYRIFRLSELIDNGSNAIDPVLGRHRRRAEWKAVIESVHPHCMCILMPYLGAQKKSDRELKVA